MKNSVTKFDLEAAFKALDEVNYAESDKGLVARRKNLAESMKVSQGKLVTETLLEDYYDLEDDNDMSAAAKEQEAEVAQAKLARIEKIVDLDAKTADDLLPSYVGKVIIQCPQCMNLFYKNEEDIEKDSDDPTTCNVNEPCQHCGNISGYTLIGKVDSVSDSEMTEFTGKDSTEDQDALDLDLDFDNNEDADKTADEDTVDTDTEDATETTEDNADDEAQEKTDEDLDLDLNLESLNNSKFQKTCSDKTDLDTDNHSENLSLNETFTIGDDLTDDGEEANDNSEKNVQVLHDFAKPLADEEPEDEEVDITVTEAKHEDADYYNGFLKDACYFINSDGYFDIYGSDLTKKTNDIIAKFDAEVSGKKYGKAAKAGKTAADLEIIDLKDGGKRVQIKGTKVEESLVEDAKSILAAFEASLDSEEPVEATESIHEKEIDDKTIISDNKSENASLNERASSTADVALETATNQAVDKLKELQNKIENEVEKTAEAESAAETEAPVDEALKEADELKADNAAFKAMINDPVFKDFAESCENKDGLTESVKSGKKLDEAIAITIGIDEVEDEVVANGPADAMIVAEPEATAVYSASVAEPGYFCDFADAEPEECGPDPHPILDEPNPHPILDEPNPEPACVGPECPVVAPEAEAPIADAVAATIDPEAKAAAQEAEPVDDGDPEDTPEDAEEADDEVDESLTEGVFDAVKGLGNKIKTSLKNINAASFDRALNKAAGASNAKFTVSIGDKADGKIYNSYTKLGDAIAAASKISSLPSVSVGKERVKTTGKRIVVSCEVTKNSKYDFKRLVVFQDGKIIVDNVQQAVQIIQKEVELAKLNAKEQNRVAKSANPLMDDADDLDLDDSASNDLDAEVSDVSTDANNDLGVNGEEETADKNTEEVKSDEKSELVDDTNKNDNIFNLDLDAFINKDSRLQSLADQITNAVTTVVNSATTDEDKANKLTALSTQLKNQEQRFKNNATAIALVQQAEKSIAELGANANAANNAAANTANDKMKINGVDQNVADIVATLTGNQANLITKKIIKVLENNPELFKKFLTAAADSRPDDKDVDTLMKTINTSIGDAPKKATTNTDTSVGESLDISEAEATRITEALEKFVEAKNTKDFDMADLDECDDATIEECISTSLTKVYENVANFKLTDCSVDSGKFIVEGMINFNSGKARATKYIFTEAKIQDAKVVLTGLNEMLDKNSNFNMNCTVENGTKLIAESLSYKFTVDNTLVEGLVKASK